MAVTYYLLVYPSKAAVDAAYPRGTPWKANLMPIPSLFDTCGFAAYSGAEGSPVYLAPVSPLYMTFPWTPAGLADAKRAYPQIDWAKLPKYGSAPNI